jgi:hypothetical protein
MLRARMETQIVLRRSEYVSILDRFFFFPGGEFSFMALRSLADSPYNIVTAVGKKPEEKEEEKIKW